ncbi:MAG: tetratricopeptide repeat protein [Gemmatimonadaceae bacterium]
MASRGRALTAASAIAISAFSAPRIVHAQARGQQPGADTPRILIATCHTATPSPLGVDVAEALRSRVQSENSIRQLYVLSRNDINNYLTSSGYKADSALSVSDLKELAKLMRADEILDCTGAKTSNGVHVDSRLMLARDVSLAQPLPGVDARDPGDAAKRVEKELTDARKALPDYRKCETALRDQKWAEASAAARAGLAKDPNSTLSQLCLMSAYQYGKSGPDSVLRVAEAIMRSDSANALAMRNAVDAYTQKGDTAKAVQTMVRLARFDPTVRPTLLTLLGAMNKPELALPIANEMLQDNPGDPQLLRMRFLLLASAKDYKKALAAGEDWMKADTAAATADLYTRMIAIASADSQPQVASQYAARAVQKFPNKADLYMLYAQTLRKSGQLQQSLDAAKRAVQLDPKVENGVAFVLVTYGELKQTDSALAWARQIVAKGADKAAVGQGLLPIVGIAVKAAQDTVGKDAAAMRQSWMNAYSLASTVDSIAPSAQLKLFVGLASFQVGLNALQNLNKSRSCADAQLADDMWSASQIALPQAAAYDRNTAGQLMGAIQQYYPNIAPAKKQLCKASTRSGTKH